MTLVIASLYLLISAFLFGSAIYILSRDPFVRLNQAYACLAFAQLGWVGTLFIFNATPVGPTLLWIGRANFAAAALAAPAVFGFVQALLKKPLRWTSWILIETLLIAGLSLGTGLIDQTEAVRGSVHLTTYGWLFPLYIVHLLLYLLPALWQALTPPRHFASERQVRLVGMGMLVTAGVGMTTNVVLPYGFGNFHLIDIGNPVHNRRTGDDCLCCLHLPHVQCSGGNTHGTGCRFADRLRTGTLSGSRECPLRPLTIDGSDGTSYRRRHSSADHQCIHPAAASLVVGAVGSSAAKAEKRASTLVADICSSYRKYLTDRYVRDKSMSRTYR